MRLQAVTDSDGCQMRCAGSCHATPTAANGRVALATSALKSMVQSEVSGMHSASQIRAARNLTPLSHLSWCARRSGDVLCEGKARHDEQRQHRFPPPSCRTSPQMQQRLHIRAADLIWMKGQELELERSIDR